MFRGALGKGVQDNDGGMVLQGGVRVVGLLGAEFFFISLCSRVCEKRNGGYGRGLELEQEEMGCVAMQYSKKWQVFVWLGARWNIGEDLVLEVGFVKVCNSGWCMGLEGDRSVVVVDQRKVLDW